MEKHSSGEKDGKVSRKEFMAAMEMFESKQVKVDDQAKKDP